MFRRIAKNQNVHSQVNELLNLIRLEDIITLVPSSATVLAAYAMSEIIPRLLTGKDVIRPKMEREAHKNQIYEKFIINSATEKVWQFHLSDLQRDRFETLANSANEINRNRTRFTEDSMLERMTRIDGPQITNDSFVDNILNGTSFHNNNNLIWPAGNYNI